MKFIGVWAICFVSWAGHSFGAMITVPNANFSSSANNGTIKGSLISGGQTANPLGTGPWSASTTALAGLLAPPQASIGSGSATISSLLGLGVLGQSNSARFYQSLSATYYAPNTTYTLSATINAGAALNTSLLSQNGLGIALTANGVSNVVASSGGAGTSLSLISGTQYRLEIQYTTGTLAPSGLVGLKLFSGENASLASVNLLGSASFDDVALAASAVPEPSAALFLCLGVTLLIGGRRYRSTGLSQK